MFFACRFISSRSSRDGEIKMPLPGDNCVLTNEEPLSLGHYVLKDLNSGRLYRARDLFRFGHVVLTPTTRAERELISFNMGPSKRDGWTGLEVEESGDANEEARYPFWNG